MFGKLKKILGVEGVKLELRLPEVIDSESGTLSGTLHFYSMNTQRVTRVEIVFKEKYKRGRGKDKLIDEYELGRIELDKNLLIEKDESAELDFDIPFRIYKSRMDKFEEKNFLSKRLAKLAKFAKNVRSVYTVEAKANVEGTVLHPIVSKQVKVR
nr:sporulation protein [Saprospiraceae bacterium]